MPSERDAGMQALQQGNGAAAIPLLETACQQNPGDFDAFLFLGAAYGQVGQQMDAINAITRAVQLQPANAQARYNLAVAMEQGGYRDQAIIALGQALTLQPNYPKAQESLRRLQGSNAPASAATSDPISNPSYTPADSGPPQAPETGYSAEPPPSGAAPLTAPSFDEPETSTAALPQVGFGQLDEEPLTSPQPAYGQPVANDASTVAAPGYNPSPAPVYGQPLYGAPPAQTPVDSPYGQRPATGPYTAPPPVASPYGAPPPAPSPYGAPPAAPGPYGAPPPAAGPYAAPPAPSNPYATPGPSPYSPPAASPYGSLQNSGPYASPGSQGLYGQGAAYTREASGRHQVEDSFNLAQAAKDWLRIIVKPGAFFDEMRGSTGMLAPLALMLLYFVPIILSIVLSGARMGMAFRQTAGLGPLFASGSVVMYLLIGVPFIAVGVFLSAWALHLIGLLFGNRSPYSASFRALIYGYAPVPILQVFAAIIPNANPAQPNPLVWIITLAGLIWGLVLTVRAISSEQEIGIGQSIGVVVLSCIGVFILLIGIGIAVGIVAAIGMAAAGSTH